MSVRESRAGGVLTGARTTAHYANFLRDPASLELASTSIGLSVAVTLATLVAAYPVALFLHRVSRRWQPFFVALTIAPLLVSAVVRTYGWMALLGDQGPVNDALQTDPATVAVDWAGRRWTGCGGEPGPIPWQ